MSNQALYERLGQSAELISTKLAELIKLSTTEFNDSTKEDNEGDDGTAENSEISTAATSIAMVNTQTVQLIKGVQDLLVLTRTIREKWLLTQIADTATEQSAASIDTEELKQLLSQTIEDIVGDNNFAAAVMAASSTLDTAPPENP